MRLIDADALKKTFCENCMCNTEISVCSENSVRNCAVQNIINGAPKIDARPVLHGKWENSPTGNPNFKYCSECGTCIKIGKRLKFFYCLNCGAKMDGGNPE